MDLNSTVAHRAVFRTQDDAALRTVRRITADWLRAKFGDAPSASGTHHLDDSTVLSSHTLHDRSGAEEALRIELREDRKAATWRTSVLARIGAELSFVAVNLEVFPNSAASLNAGRPRIISELTAALRRPADGPAQLTTNALLVPARGVDALISVLCDPDRRLPAVVAARPVRPDSLWSRRVEKALTESAGSASLFLLDGALAVDALRSAIGEAHRIAPGAVRTFLPEVDPAWPVDGARHRYITAARLHDPGDDAWKGIPRTVHRIAAEQPMPEQLLALAFPDETRRRRESRPQVAAAATASAVDLERLNQEVAELTELLDVADTALGDAEASRRLAERRVAAMENSLHQASTRWDDEVENHLHTLAELERAQAEAAELRARLVRQGKYEDAVVETAAPVVPRSFEELWMQLEGLPGLLVTAQRGLALALDSDRRAPSWAAKAWMGFRALSSYAQAAQGGFEGNFYQHCQAAPPGSAIFPVTQVSMTESSSTMRSWGHERMLPVPPSVDAGGVATMVAHLRLGRGGAYPRVHFFDDTKGSTGSVIVGYVGPHLTNALTN
ncbi:hypothetical protein AB0N09_27965 [Streptomyces erythrochromogenes]|uniref:hypothetical protein n=1 Tax=Streptomyces erythrochromogenes TaxID=285574 RepID=UPI00342C52F7